MPDIADRNALLLEVIEKLCHRMRESEDEEEAFKMIAEGIREVSGSDFGVITLLEGDGIHLKMVGASGPMPVAKEDFARYEVSPSILAAMEHADGSKSIRWDSVEEMPEPARLLAKRYGASFALVFSIVRRRKLLGYLVAANMEGKPAFDEEAEALVRLLANYIALALDNMRTEFLMSRSREDRQSVISIAPIGIMWLDPKGIILSANKQILAIFEKEHEEDLVGTSIFEIPSVHKSGIDVLVLQGMEGHAVEKMDLHYVPRQDRAFYLHVKVAPSMDDNREVKGVVMVAMDTTSKVRLENQLERSYEKLTQTFQELERVNKMKSQFIDVVSHELRTPLTVMRGYVDLVDGEYSAKLDPKFSQKFKIIKANTDKLYALVESMLDISRLEKGSLEIHAEPVKVDTILDDIVANRMKDAEEKKQTLTLTVDGSIPIINADRRRMRDVFNNLVDNAIKYTEEGGKVQVGVRDEGRMIHVWVKDNGIGIPLENLGKIFDRFYIVAKDDLAHQVDRIGLSLPIAKGIIEAHGGRLWVESQVGKGSVFHIDLPKQRGK